MAPVSLNPPGPSIQDQNQLFISPSKHDSTSLSCRTFFDILDQRQTGDIRELRHDDQEDDKLVFHGGSSSNHQVCNSSFVSPHQPVMADPSSACGHNLSFYKVKEEENKSGYGSAKWMSSKIRLTRKMMSPSNSLATDKAFNITTPTFQSQGHGNTQRNPSSYNSNSITRVCADCNTSSTPLWRSGPKGPKSLCNACGIRQRKARKAMAEAANGFAASMDASSTKTKVHHKEKKCRTKHFGQFKNWCKSTTTCITTAGTSQGERKLDFKDFAISFRSNSAFQQVFSRDEEVAEAALLLMDLSCGFIYF